MRTWLQLHAAALRSSLLQFASSPLPTLLSMVVIGVALSLPAGLYLGLAQLQARLGQLASDPQVTLFLEVDANASQVAELRDRLQTHPDVRSVRFVAKEDALSELRRRSGLGDVVDTLGGNPLPDAFVVTAKDNQPQALERLREAAAGWPKVAQVTLDSAWARRLEAGLRLGRLLTIVLAALLAAALIGVTFNTIRLQVLSRREEIEVARLIGATRGFIRRPFLYFGLLQGLGGGMIAWGILAGTLWLVDWSLRDLIQQSIFAQGLSTEIGALMVALSTAVGALGAWLSISRHVWQTEPA